MTAKIGSTQTVKYVQGTIALLAPLQDNEAA